MPAPAPNTAALSSGPAPRGVLASALTLTQQSAQVGSPDTSKYSEWMVRWHSRQVTAPAAASPTATVSNCKSEFGPARSLDIGVSPLDMDGAPGFYDGSATF